MTAIVSFIGGVYKIRGTDTDISERTFMLVDGYRETSDGQGYFTVDGSSCNPPLSGVPERNIRIRVESADHIKLVEGELPETEASVTAAVDARLERINAQTDEEIIERLRTRFNILEAMSEAVKGGVVRGMIVAGPPGVGKSHNVEEVLSRANLFNQVAGYRDNFEIVKGAMSALGLYRKLYDRRDRGEVIVFDDCDSILLDTLSLNILKAALDSGKKRRISWNTDSAVLRREGIPDSFTFDAGVVFITNISFDNVRSKQLREHLAALESRCHYIDLEMSTDREKVLRIKQIIQDGMLDSYNFQNNEQQEIIQFVDDNKSSMRELSLRSVLKLADLCKAMPDKWRTVAQLTILKGAA